MLECVDGQGPRTKYDKPRAASMGQPDKLRDQMSHIGQSEQKSSQLQAGRGR